MRFDPKNGRLYKYVGGNDKERRLYYHVDVEGLMLSVIGQFGDLNLSVISNPLGIRNTFMTLILYILFYR